LAHPAQGAVEGARLELELPFAAAQGFLHDRVAVPLAVAQSEEDVELDGAQGQEVFGRDAVRHRASGAGSVWGAYMRNAQSATWVPGRRKGRERRRERRGNGEGTGTG